jgi:S-adenosylmethionine:tRNA ribosyltransferase-isomerase
LVQVSDFNYELPENLIAQEPPAQRGDSRMLVLSRANQDFHDDVFANFYRFVRPGDCLVLNDTRVFPARLHGKKAHGDGPAVEVFLLRALNDLQTDWKALVKPGKRVRRCGDRIVFAEGLSAEVTASEAYGERTLHFEAAAGTGAVADLLEGLGNVPLPPYIRRAPDAADRERYQTVFANKSGSAAAPTAGLHFTQEMLDRCREAGSIIAHVTLHVGLGTFAPLRFGASSLDKIQLHEEYFEITAPEAAKLRTAQRLFCVGTTSVRTIETALLRGDSFQGVSGETNLFIHPGFRFRGAGAMLTNFHLPGSSLLMLVCAFAGAELALAAYRHAVEEKYRFFSYGDCMLIE